MFYTKRAIETDRQGYSAVRIPKKNKRQVKNSKRNLTPRSKIRQMAEITFVSAKEAIEMAKAQKKREVSIGMYFCPNKKFEQLAAKRTRGLLKDAGYCVKIVTFELLPAFCSEKKCFTKLHVSW